MANKKPVNFEKSLEQLESLVNEMEQGSLSLEDSMKAFEAGVKLARSCQQALAEAEHKVEMLSQDHDKPIPFRENDPEQ